MKISLTNKLQSSIAQAESLVEILNNIGLNGEADQLSSQMNDIKQGKFFIGLVGLAKRGKSTLLNAMLGRNNDKIAPVDKFPATNVISLFSLGEEDSAFVVTANGDKKSITHDEIRMYTCEEYNRGNQKNVLSVEVTGNFSSLEPGVFLVDTPGCGNALSFEHSSMLHNFLPRADALIFLVTADAPIGEEELELIEKIQQNSIQKVFLAVNKIDREEEQDVLDAVVHNKKILEARGLSQVGIYPISAKKYFETGTDAGVENLLVAVSELISREKVDILRERLESQMDIFRSSAHSLLNTELQLSKKSSEELQLELEHLKKFEDSIAAEFPKIESGFLCECKDASADFIDKLTSVKKNVGVEVEKMIESFSLASVSRKSKTLHIEVQHIIEKHIRPHLLAWQGNFARAVENLSNDVHTRIKFASPELTGSLALKHDLKKMVSIGSSGLGPSILATVTMNLPGMVGGAISSYAASLATTATQTAATVGWNPLTWGGAASAAGTGTASAAVGVLGGGVTTVLAAVSSVVTPLLFAWAGYRIFSAYRENKKAQKKDLISMAWKMVDTYMEDLHEAFKTMSRSVPKQIISDMKKLNTQQISQLKDKIHTLQSNRVEPKRINLLESQLGALDSMGKKNDSYAKSNIDW